MRPFVLLAMMVLTGAGGDAASPSLEQLETRAKAGDVRAQTELGRVLLFTTRTTPADPKAGPYWLGKAADAGDPEAQTLLADYDLVPDGRPALYGEAVALYEKAASRDYAPAVRKLAVLYATGQGVAMDDDKAFTLFKRCAALGDAECQYGLGSWYYNGIATPQDPAQGFPWLLKAAQQNYILAMFRVGDGYENGDGVAQDLDQAAKWYARAGEAGEMRAQFRLGEFLLRGYGVPRDRVRAEAWLRRSADQGFVPAMNEVGNLEYQRGRPEIARAWYQKGAALDCTESLVPLGALSSRGEGVPQSWAEAFALNRRAAVQGWPEAELNLAWYYRNGRSVTPDPVMAYAWASLAARHDEGDARDLMADLAKTLAPADVERANAIAGTLVTERIRGAPCGLIYEW